MERHTGTKGLHDGVDVLCLDTVDDVVAAPRDKVAASHNLHSGLGILSKGFALV
jgi:hypothetical protein